MILARDVESAVKCALRALRRDEETRGLNFMVTARTTCTTTPQQHVTRNRQASVSGLHNPARSKQPAATGRNA